MERPEYLIDDPEFANNPARGVFVARAKAIRSLEEMARDIRHFKKNNPDSSCYGYSLTHTVKMLDEGLRYARTQAARADCYVKLLEDKFPTGTEQAKEMKREYEIVIAGKYTNKRR